MIDLLLLAATFGLLLAGFQTIVELAHPFNHVAEPGLSWVWQGWRDGSLVPLMAAGAVVCCFAFGLVLDRRLPVRTAQPRGYTRSNLFLASLLLMLATTAGFWLTDGRRLLDRPEKGLPKDTLLLLYSLLPCLLGFGAFGAAALRLGPRLPRWPVLMGPVACIVAATLVTERLGQQGKLPLASPTLRTLSLELAVLAGLCAAAAQFECRLTGRFDRSPELAEAGLWLIAAVNQWLTLLIFTGCMCVRAKVEWQAEWAVIVGGCLAGALACRYALHRRRVRASSP